MDTENVVSKSWGFVAIVQKFRVKVLVTQEGNGSIKFLSVAPVWFTKQYRSRDVMTSSLLFCWRVMLTSGSFHFGFEKLQLDRILIKCAEGNIKSAGMPLRLRFAQTAVTEETRTRNGGEHRTLVLTLDRSDYYSE